ncbi:MAG TPA: hypothetical protein VGM56_32310 [Byssovorax sp.]
MIFSFLAVAALAACTNTISMSGASPAIPEARVVAEKDLDCPQQQIHIEEQLGGRLLASGCGRKALYHAQCVALQCTVRGEDEPSIPFRDRPDPGSPLLP